MTKYLKLYIWKEKHGDRYIQVNSESGEYNMFLSILKERFKQGWYEGVNQELMEKTIKNYCSLDAKNLLRQRKGYEYEGYEIVEQPIIYE